MDDCIFCKIIEKKIPSKILYEDDYCIIFNDIAPQAPIHLLAIPKRHIEKISDMKEDEQTLVGHLIFCLNKMAREAEITNDG